MENKKQFTVFVLISFALLLITFAITSVYASIPGVQTVIVVPPSLQNNGTLAANATFTSCLHDAIVLRDYGFDSTKAARTVCIAAASSTNDSRSQSATCGNTYADAMFGVQDKYVAAKKICNTLPHTWWEGFWSYFE